MLHCSRWFWQAKLVALLLLIGGIGLCATYLYGWPRMTTLPMDARPVLLAFTGLHELETFADGTGVYRWTQGQAQLTLPNPGGSLLVRLQLAGGPGRYVPVVISSPQAQLPIQVAAEPRTYAVLFPAAAAERVTLEIDSPVIKERHRTLGVVVAGVSIIGGGSVPLFVGLALWVATATSYLLMSQALRGPQRHWQGAGLLLLLLALLLFWQTRWGWVYGLLVPLLLLTGVTCLISVVLERWLWRHPVPPEPVITLSPAKQDVAWLAGVLLAALLIRLPWLAAADPVGDMELAARRMWLLHMQGLAGAYLLDGDYMPLRLYLLAGLSQLVLPLGSDFHAPLPAITKILIKLPGLLADLLTITLLFWYSRRRVDACRAAMIAALYALSPPVWINVAWWGQVDALLMVFLAALCCCSTVLLGAGAGSAGQLRC
ncbi:MAG: hypothetical protein HC837_17810 [Chloroflexaceae bacterium]|nr:hypothetical protein [Chloroflexaceae bacterium]